MSTHADGPPDDMRYPEWCRCGWNEGELGVEYHECIDCGYVRIPWGEMTSNGWEDAISEGSEGMGPFWWHPVLIQDVQAMRPQALARALRSPNRYYRQMVMRYARLDKK